jgi:hypothetical protein
MSLRKHPLWERVAYPWLVAGSFILFGILAACFYGPRKHEAFLWALVGFLPSYVGIRGRNWQRTCVFSGSTNGRLEMITCMAMDDTPLFVWTPIGASAE